MSGAFFQGWCVCRARLHRLDHTPHHQTHSISAATMAAAETGDAILLAAAPWFAADHVTTSAEFYASEGDAVATCDWCSVDTGIGRVGCDRCGCAVYCGARCAAAARAVHAANCARLALLARRDNALRPVCAAAPPMFVYE